MHNYKLNISELPTYKDGSFLLYEIFHKNTVFPKEILKQVSLDEFYYDELSLSDSIIFESEKREKKIISKIRIAQDRDITSKNVLRIDDNYYKVFNIFHFKNKDGIPQSDITLEEYLHPFFEEEKND